MNKTLPAFGVIAALAFTTLTIASPAMAATGLQDPIVTESNIADLSTAGWIDEVDGDLYVDGETAALGASALDTYTVETPGYDRTAMFGPAWSTMIDGCDTRNRILQRDFATFTLASGSTCTVTTGVFDDPYSGETLNFQRTNFPNPGDGNSSAVQIDHIIPLKAGWNGGASGWTQEKRVELANDPANLWASKGSLNSSKGDRLYDSWTVPNTEFTCQYVAQMVWVATKYDVAVLPADKAAMVSTLSSPECELPISDETPAHPTPVFDVPTSVQVSDLAAGISIPFSNFEPDTSVHFVVDRVGGGTVKDVVIQADANGEGVLTIEAAAANGEQFSVTYTAYPGAEEITATQTFTARDEVVEPIVVTTSAPTVTPADECGVEGTIVYPDTTGVTYAITAGDSGSVVVTATADDGYVLSDDSATTWTLDTVEECEIGTPTFDVPDTIAASDLAAGVHLPFSGFPVNTDVRFVFSLADGTVLSDTMVTTDAQGAGILDVQATLDGNPVPAGTVFALTYYIDGEPFTQNFTATGDTTTPVDPSNPGGGKGETPSSNVSGESEIAYTGGDVAPALWIGGGVVLALIAGGVIFLIRRRDNAATPETAPDEPVLPANED